MKIHIKICASGLEKKTGVQSITMKVSSLIRQKREVEGYNKIKSRNQVKKNRQTIPKNQQSKSQFLAKINKRDKPLPRLIRKKKKKKKNANVKNKRKNITIYLIAIQE